MYINNQNIQLEPIENDSVGLKKYLVDSTTNPSEINSVVQFNKNYLNFN